MIVKMKKVTLLCLADDQQRTLERLGELGVLHLVPLTPPAGHDLEAARALLEAARKAHTVLVTHGGPAHEKKDAGPIRDALPVDAVVRQVHELVSLRERLLEEQQELQIEKERTEPFGQFNPALIRSLGAAGMPVRLYRLPPKMEITVPEGAGMFEVAEAAGERCVAVVGRGEVTCAAPEFAPPEESLRDLQARIDEIDRYVRVISDEVRTLGRQEPRVADYVTRLEDQVHFIEARAGMGAAPRVAYLQGFCPAELADTLRASAPAHGWGLAIDDPAASDRVPVLIRNPAWARPIESLFKFIKILPGYHEVDVSVSFLIFMSLFCGMIIGDAVYGAVFLGATLFARAKMRKAPPEPFRLMIVFSVCTMIWGILTGVYLGIPALPGPLRAVRVDWLTEDRNIMFLCLLIGAIHLSIAHLWNVVRWSNTWQALAQVGWVYLIWATYFMARFMLLGVALPPTFGVLGIVGLVLVLLFMTPPARLKSEFANHLMLPLSIASGFGDILSYLRLFALGVASVKLEGAFFTLAETVGFGGFLTGLGAAAIILAGNALNLVLGALSVLVHGVRLNALEFSMHLGLEWSGAPYAPFAKRHGAKPQPDPLPLQPTA